MMGDDMESLRGGGEVADDFLGGGGGISKATGSGTAGGDGRASFSTISGILFSWYGGEVRFMELCIDRGGNSMAGVARGEETELGVCDIGRALATSAALEEWWPVDKEYNEPLSSCRRPKRSDSVSIDGRIIVTGR